MSSALISEYAVGSSIKVPSPKTAMTDLVEFWCYSVLVEAPPREIYLRMKECQRILIEHGEELNIQDYGRVHNRIGIATLVGEFCGREANDSSLETSLCHQKSSYWGKLMEGLSLCHQKSSYWEKLMEGLNGLRHNFLRFDRDAKEGDEKNDSPDEDLAYLPMFDELFNELISMIKLQRAIATLREQLQEEAKMPPSSKPQRRMSTIIGNYQGTVAKEGNGDDNHVLLRFLKRDLLKAHKKGETKSLPKHILEGLDKVMEKGDANFSLRLLQRKTQVLLRDWADQNLAPPTLVRLGYGGLSTTNATQNDQQTVSSWGTYSDAGVKEEQEKFINSEPLDARNHEADPEVLRRAAKAVEESDLSEDYLTPDEEAPSVSSVAEKIAAVVADRARNSNNKPAATVETSRPAAEESDLSEDYLTPDEEAPSVSSVAEKIAAVVADRARNNSTNKPAATVETSRPAAAAAVSKKTNDEHQQRKHKTAMKKPALTPPPKVVNIVAEKFNGRSYNRVGDDEGDDDDLGPSSRKRKERVEAWSDDSDGDDIDAKKSRNTKKRRRIEPRIEEEEEKTSDCSKLRRRSSDQLGLRNTRPRTTTNKRGNTTVPTRVKRSNNDPSCGKNKGSGGGEQKWTLEEEAAVRKGIEDHGTDWDTIRKDYASILGNRGRTSLRRKYLEMKMRGSLEG
eukprot:CAMPEP_0194066572 /NCGR_PEP_ID=MMETSP0009_2-20130614/86096_1 /TAXON_ID=210454 /ORGANISM="Grammatophora oceanica, Strain CCMP 410" /LENGTH=678 /DNA_ID=CAMNT_0038719539 /DNA_START=64 /DNA_END=2100 /DNA_ORIENTATION=-